MVAQDRPSWHEHRLMRSARPFVKPRKFCAQRIRQAHAGKEAAALPAQTFFEKVLYRLKSASRTQSVGCRLRFCMNSISSFCIFWEASIIAGIITSIVLLWISGIFSSEA